MKADQKIKAHEVFFKWLKLLFKIIDISSIDAAQHLQMLYSLDVWSTFEALKPQFIVHVSLLCHFIIVALIFFFIFYKVVSETKKIFPTLTLSVFHKLYTSFEIWPEDFLFEFLKQFEFPNDASLNNPLLKDVLEEVLKR